MSLKDDNHIMAMNKIFRIKAIKPMKFLFR